MMNRILGCLDIKYKLLFCGGENTDAAESYPND